MKRQACKTAFGILCCITFLAACGVFSEYESVEGTQKPAASELVDNTLTTSFLSYQYKYAQTHAISLNRDPGQAELSAWITEQDILQQSPLAANREFSLFSEAKYKLTASDGSYYYRGETKDNYPDGFGVLSTSSHSVAGTETILYIGSFKEGRYHGYGLLFAEPTSEDENILLNLSARGMSTEQLQELSYSFVNYVSFEGEFKDGLPNGTGNEFYCSLYYAALASDMAGAESLNPNDIGFTITVGQFKDGHKDGDVMQYRSGILSYEGEMSDDKRDGHGIQYQNGSTKVLYEGEFKDDQYHGKGTLYDENGQVIYSGEWRNGDYA